MPRSEDDFDPKKCSCGSGEEKDAEYDARGIFLTYACSKCRAKTLAGYRSDALSIRVTGPTRPLKGMTDD